MIKIDKKKLHLQIFLQVLQICPMYPFWQPSVQAPSMWLQGSLCKQYHEHFFVQSFPYVPELHPWNKYTYV